MKIPIQCCAVLILVIYTGPCWAANQQVQSNTAVARPEIPFKLFDGFLIVLEGRVGDHARLKLALDTGVTHSVISDKLAAQIPESRRRAGKVLNFDKTMSAEWIEVPDIELGPIHVNNFSMMIGDLRYFQSFGAHVDAVIGLDLLRLSNFTIDYDAHKVTFGPTNADFGVPMEVDDICITVQLMMGDRPVRLLVDTGAPTMVLYEDRVASRLPQLRMERETTGRSIGGWLPSKRGFIPNARLGSSNLEGTVFLVKEPPPNLLAGIDGYFGTASLKARRIDFNFETNTLSWQK